MRIRLSGAYSCPACLRLKLPILIELARTCQVNTPARFANDFILPTLDEIRILAELLGLPLEVKYVRGHRADRCDAFLVFLLRMKKTCTMEDLANHRVLSYDGSNWSTTKVQYITKLTGQILHRIHSRRISWSDVLAARISTHYVQAMRATSGDVLRLMHPNIACVIDGTYRPIPRAQPGPNNEDLQRATYNGWLHGHFTSWQSIVVPDGMTLSATGPFLGTNNDRDKVNLTNIEDVFIEQCAGYQILGDSGYRPFVEGQGNPIVRRPDGW